MSRLAKAAIAALDRGLALRGQDRVKLARLSDAPEGQQSSFYCEDIPAQIVLVQPQETMGIGAGGAIQDTKVIISPTRMTQRQWPQPPRKDDRIYIPMPDGSTLIANVESVLIQTVQGVAVRYEMNCRS